MDDEVIERFVSITGCSARDAAEWIVRGDYVLEDAIVLFFASQNVNGSHHSLSKRKYSDDTDDVRRPDPVKLMKLVEDNSSIGLLATFKYFQEMCC